MADDWLGARHAVEQFEFVVFAYDKCMTAGLRSLGVFVISGEKSTTAFKYMNHQKIAAQHAGRQKSNACAKKKCELNLSSQQTRTTGYAGGILRPRLTIRHTKNVLRGESHCCVRGNHRFPLIVA
jgi:hypothetical protein